MSINQIYTQQAGTVVSNKKTVKQQDGSGVADNIPRETNGSKLNMALKCLGAAAVAGLVIYGGSKGLKYLKGKNVATTLPALVNKTPVRNSAQAVNVAASTLNGMVRSSAETVSAAITTFKGMSAADIVKAYKSGNKTIYRELAKIAHPDKTNNTALVDFFSRITSAINSK